MMNYFNTFDYVIHFFLIFPEINKRTVVKKSIHSRKYEISVDCKSMDIISIDVTDCPILIINGKIQSFIYNISSKYLINTYI